MLISTFKYAIDTCSFTQLRRTYPQDVFPSVWHKFEKMSKSGLICSVDEVYFEILNQDDDLSSWIKGIKEIFLPIGENEIQNNATKILSTHANLLDVKKNKSGADPFLIAAAIVHRCIVVTEEKPSGGPHRSKIPDVCKYYTIECIPILEMLRREKLLL